MGDEGVGEVSSSSSGVMVYQSKYPAYTNMNGANSNKMLTSYHSSVVNRNAIMNSAAATAAAAAAAATSASFTVLTGIGNVALNSSSSFTDYSLAASDIGRVDLDLWDLDINAPSASPSSRGHSPLSALPPPCRRSSDTSSTSG